MDDNVGVAGDEVEVDDPAVDMQLHMPQRPLCARIYR